MYHQIKKSELFCDFRRKWREVGHWKLIHILPQVLSPTDTTKQTELL